MASFWKPGTSHSAELKPGNAVKVEVKARATLSGNVMSMKFMKRKDDKDEVRKEEDRKRRRLLHYDESGTSPPVPAADGEDGGLVVTVEKVSLYSALPGRRSFGGANKIVERQYANIMESRRIDMKYNGNGDETADDELLKAYARMRKSKRKGDLKKK